MSRAINEFVAVLGDLMPGGVPMLALALFLVTGLVAALWFWWPAWLPSGSRRRRPSRQDGTDAARRGPWLRRLWRRLRLRRPHLGRLRWRWRRRWWWHWRWWRRHRPAPLRAPDLPENQVPDLPAAVLALSADDLAAAGRYREAVRERLRAVVRDLIERRVLGQVPGWTVTELAWIAGRARPETAPPLRAACELFSEIWYGLHPATADDDRIMRERAEQVRAALDAAPGPDGALDAAPGRDAATATVPGAEVVR